VKSLSALIPRTYGAIELIDFRPISLVSGVYKIVPKVLANNESCYGEDYLKASERFC
jgi:hypothetical protein